MVCLPALIRSGSSSPSIGEGTHAEHAVLALQRDLDAFGDVVGDQRRDADAQVDVEAVAQFLRGARGHFLTCPCHGLDPPLDVQARLRTVRCSMRFSASGTWTMRLTKMPGVTMWSGSISPGCDQVLDLGHA